MDTTIIETGYNSEIVQPQEQISLTNERDYQKWLSYLSNEYSKLQKEIKKVKSRYEKIDNSFRNQINERKYRKIASAYRATKNKDLLEPLNLYEKTFISLLNLPFEWIDDLNKSHKDCKNIMEKINKLIKNPFDDKSSEEIYSLYKNALEIKNSLPSNKYFLFEKKFFCRL